MTPAPAALPAFEHTLWSAARRHGRGTVDQRFAADVVEFGRAGAFQTCETMLAAPNAADNIDAVLHDIAVRPVQGDIALVTDVSEVRYPGEMQWANRSSVRDRSSAAWRIRLYEGTPCPPGP